MDFPFSNNAPAGEGGATSTQDDFWAFNPQQPPPIAGAPSDDTSLDELLALYQTAQDAPAPFAPMEEPEAYPSFPPFGAEEGGLATGDPATDQPFPPFGSDTDMAFPAFGEEAPAAGGEFDFSGGPVFDAFDSPQAAGAAPAADAFAAPAPAADDFSFGGGDAFPAFGAETEAAPEAGAFDFGGDAATTFPAFDEPAAAPAAGGEFDFGGGPVFEAFDAAPVAPEADPFAMPAPEAAADPFVMPASEAFAAPEAAPAESFDFGGGEAAFPAFDAPAPAAPEAPAAEAGDGFDFSFDGGPVFEAFDAPAAPEATAAPEAPAAEAEGFDFSFDGGPVFEAIEPAAETPTEAFAAPAAPEAFSFDEGPTFPAFDTPEAAAPEAPVAPEADGFDFSFDGGPVFEAVDAPAAPEAAPVVPAAEEEPQEFLDLGDLDGPVFEAIETPAPEPVAPPAPEPVAAAPVVEPPAAPEAVVPVAEPVVEPPAPKQPDPEQTLRLKEFPAGVPPAPPAEVAGLDAASLAAITGREVVIRTPDERRAASAQLTQVVGSLSSGLDELQGRLAHLYADLQRAAVRRAPVDEIQEIASELAKVKVEASEKSDLYKQALYMRQVADAYLQLLKEI